MSMILSGKVTSEGTATFDAGPIEELIDALAKDNERLSARVAELERGMPELPDQSTTIDDLRAEIESLIKVVAEDKRRLDALAGEPISQIEFTEVKKTTFGELMK